MQHACYSSLYGRPKSIGSDFGLRRRRCRPSSGPPRGWTQHRRSGQPPKVRGQRSGDGGAQRRSGRQERRNVNPCA